MADKTNILDFIAERFSRLDARIDRVLAEQGTTNQRLASLEARVTSLDASIVHVQERLDGMQRQLDHMSGRLDRIERRLDLREAATSDQG